MDGGSDSSDQTPQTSAGAEQSAQTPQPVDTETSETTAEPEAAAARTQRRTELNLLGQADTQSGESRRNENIQFNLIDNNVLRELNIRLGVTATLITEFQPDRSYFGAEFGSASEAPLHLDPASFQGVHGSAYWGHQNSVVSARSFFQVGDVQPAHENDYGFSLSLPAWSGADLSLGASQQKIRGSVNGNILVPRQDERTPLATDPATRAIVATFLAGYPDALPNRTDRAERALNTNAPQVVDSDTTTIRLNQAFTEKDRLSLRHAFTSQSVDAFQLVAGRNPDTDTRAHNAGITWSRAWSPASTSDFSIGFDRLGSLLVQEERWGDLPSVFTSRLSGLGAAWIIPIDRAQNRFRYAGRFRQSRGRHNWSLGFEVSRQQFNGWESDAHRGEIVFADNFGRDAITNLRMGAPTITYLALGEMHRGYRSWLMQYFAADNWRLNSKLTMTYGLRYTPLTRPSEVNDLDEIPYGGDFNNVAPYLGLAYRLPRNWGAVRAAYAIHYGEIYPVTFQQVRFNPPGNLELFITNPNLVDPLAGVSEEDLRGALYRLSPDLSTPYSQQYNFTWELQPARSLSLQLGYVGSRSVKLFHMLETNRARFVEGIEQTTGTINERRPNPDFADFKEITNSSRGYFDAAKVSLAVQGWRGLSMDASYWFSKALDLGTSYSNTAAYLDTSDSFSPSEFDVHGEMKALSEFDQPHAFLLRGTYDLPFLVDRKGWLSKLLQDWSVFAVTLIKPGTPFTVASGADSPGFGNVDGIQADRPHLLDPSILGRSFGNPDRSEQRLPRSAFAFIQPTELRGSLGRNTFRRGPIRNVNFALSRRWAFSSDKALTFRAESVNALNTPQFDAPGSRLVNEEFGQITNTLNDGRAFRFLLNLDF